MGTDSEQCAKSGYCAWYGLRKESGSTSVADDDGESCRPLICGNIADVRTCKSLKNDNKKRMCNWKKSKCRAKKRTLKQWKKDVKKKDNKVAPRPSTNPKKHVCKYDADKTLTVGK